MTMVDEITGFETALRRDGINIAEVLRDAAIDRSMWTRWKNGTTVPRLDNWRAVENAAAKLREAKAAA